MTYDSWLRRIRLLLDAEGYTLADFAEWDWSAICEDGQSPATAAAEAIDELTRMNEADPDFFDYMAYSDADPGL